MAGQTGRRRLIVNTSVLTSPTQYSLVEVYRGLTEEVIRKGGDPLHHIRLRPVLDFALPRSQVQSIEIESLNSGIEIYWIDVNLPGLYGQQSVLPNFFTEDLVRADHQESNGARFFLDLLHQRLYQVLLAVREHQLPHGSDENLHQARQVLLALGGLRGVQWLDEFSDPAFVLRNINLFRYQRGTNAGLKALLGNLFGDAPVVVEEFCDRQINIPTNQRCRLSGARGQLGVNSILGNRIDDSQSKVNVTIGPVSDVTFKYWALTKTHWSELKALVADFVNQPLIVDFKFVVEAPERLHLLLGKSSGRLGQNAWLLQRDNEQDFVQAQLRLLV